MCLTEVFDQDLDANTDQDESSSYFNLLSKETTDPVAQYETHEGENKGHQADDYGWK